MSDTQTDNNVEGAVTVTATPPTSVSTIATPITNRSSVGQKKILKKQTSCISLGSDSAQTSTPNGLYENFSEGRSISNENNWDRENAYKHNTYSSNGNLNNDVEGLSGCSAGLENFRNFLDSIDLSKVNYKSILPMSTSQNSHEATKIFLHKLFDLRRGHFLAILYIPKWHFFINFQAIFRRKIASFV